MPPLRFARAETSIGPMLLAETDAGFAAVSHELSLESFLEPLQRRLPGFEPLAAHLDSTWLDLALSGGPLPSVDLRGLTDFEVRVYKLVRAVPPGDTVTYGEVAALIGSPGASGTAAISWASRPLPPRRRWAPRRRPPGSC